jgi:preprotein translocase subunit SecE
MAKAEKAPEEKGSKKEVKKENKAAPPRRASNQDKPNVFQRAIIGLRRWFNETIGELRKVHWPTRQEALYLTRIVIVVVIIMSLALGFLDFLFSKGIGLLVR